MLINVKNQLLSLESPKIMGILNYTEDSFFDGGKYSSDLELLQRTEKMLSEGADMIDIGVVSTRPGAADVDEANELFKVRKLLKNILTAFPNTIVSVDTWRSAVAEMAVGEGAALINDISGGTFDPNMPAMMGKLKVPYCLMHTTGKPDVMQNQTLPHHFLPLLLQYFAEKIELFREKGCKDIILDPGFGFGKTLNQNYFLLNNLKAFEIFDMPILVGLSRKSLIYKLLKTSPPHALIGTSVLNAIALQNGADILRVHDVKEAAQTIQLMQHLELCQNEIVEI